MYWSYEKIEISKNEYYDVIYCEKIKSVIAIVGNLDKEFIMNIINQHNEAVDIEYKNGICEGADIIRKINGLDKMDYQV